MTLRHALADTWLRERLTKLREDRGLTQNAVVQKAGIHKRTLQRVEIGGHVPVTPAILALLCDVYDVDKSEQSQLVELQRRAVTPGWWDEYADVIGPILAEHCELEESAREIYCYTSNVMPGLVQTEKYAHAVQRASFVENKGFRLDRLVQLRLERQRRGLRASRTFKLILDEAVLHRSISTEPVARLQLEHVVKLQQQGYIEVRVFPFKIPAVRPSSFHVFRFAGIPEYVMCLDGFLMEEHRTSEDASMRLLQAFDHWWNESTVLLEEVI